MKKTVIMLLALALVFASACGKKAPDNEQIVDIGAPDPAAVAATPGVTVPVTVEVPVTPKPRVSDSTVSNDGADALAYGVAPAARVDDTAAYIFDKGDGTVVLYAAIEYTSTGDCPAVVDMASIVFSAGGQTYAVEYVPPLSEYNSLLPNESSYLAVWHTLTESTLTADSDVTVSATLHCIKGSETRVSISGSGLYIAQNYPKFATLTGKLINDTPTSCELNMVYAAFYDADGKLLGVWYFTKNARITNEETKPFAVQMRELPISGIAENTAEIRVIGFGMS